MGANVLMVYISFFPRPPSLPPSTRETITCLSMVRTDCRLHCQAHELTGSEHAKYTVADLWKGLGAGNHRRRNACMQGKSNKITPIPLPPNQFYNSVVWIVWKVAYFEFQSHGDLWHKATIAFVEKYIPISEVHQHGVSILGSVNFGETFRRISAVWGIAQT